VKRLACAVVLAFLLAAPAAEAASLGAVRAGVRRLEAKVELMQLSVARLGDWHACIAGVPVSEYGDPDGRSGFLYDERDGTGPYFRAALAVDRTSRPGREDYLFLAMRRSGGCQSAAPLPGGTAEPAIAHAARAGGARDSVGGLERRIRRLKRAVRRLERASERFDEWESCVSLIPVTEYGDPDGGFGFVFARTGSPGFAYRPALAIDRSDWDDPDFMFVAFAGGDRPGGTCRSEPGEAVD
jgi:hypothetical protein